MKVEARRSKDRGHANYGWLDTYHTFSVASHEDPRFERFGAIRVLNEDRVSPKNGFPMHTHRNAEIFSYVLSGELTHRDSMTTSDEYFRIKRGDVQFTTGGSGISHSEQNEHESETVHFLQIWILPWKSGLTPRYHDSTIDEAAKRHGFVTIISPLRAGKNASVEEEEAAIPSVPGTIPIHADFLMGASIISKGSSATWNIGGHGAITSKQDRKVYVHLPMRERKSKIRLADGTVLSEGDGAFVTNVNDGDSLVIESVGVEEAEVVVLDSN